MQHFLFAVVVPGIQRQKLRGAESEIALRVYIVGTGNFADGLRNFKTTFSKNGEKTETLIGSDGKAAKEIHYSTHGNSSIHNNPHGHIITYDEVTGYPDWGDPINGIGSDFLKHFAGRKTMSTVIYDTNTPEDNRFKTISEFKWSMKHGAEVEFNWNSQKYGISHAGGKITIYIWNQPETTRQFNTADEVLEYVVGSDRLRDVITQVTVLDRTI